MPLSVVNNIGYLQPLLDMNQNSASRLLPPDELKVFVGDRGNLTGYYKVGRTLGNLHADHDLDAVGNDNGSGPGDLAVVVLVALLGSAARSFRCTRRSARPPGRWRTAASRNGPLCPRPTYRRSVALDAGCTLMSIRLACMTPATPARSSP